MTGTNKQWLFTSAAPHNGALNRAETPGEFHRCLFLRRVTWTSADFSHLAISPWDTDSMFWSLESLENCRTHTALRGACRDLSYGGGDHWDINSWSLLCRFHWALSFRRGQNSRWGQTTHFVCYWWELFQNFLFLSAIWMAWHTNNAFCLCVFFRRCSECLLFSSYYHPWNYWKYFILSGETQCNTTAKHLSWITCNSVLTLPW